MKESDFTDQDYEKIQRLGVLTNISKAVDNIGARLPNLAIGVFAGYPAYALALRLSISYLLSIALEIPMGYLADRMGHKKTVIVSYAAAVLAMLLLIASVMAVSATPDLAVVLLVVSAVFGACAGALGSGAFEAFQQSIIDIWATEVDSKNEKHFRESALSLSHRFQKITASVIPMLSLAAFVFFFFVLKQVVLGLLLPLIGLIYMTWYISTQFSEVKMTADVLHSEVTIWKDVFGMIRAVRSAKPNILLLGILLVFYGLIMIHVNTYYLIGEITKLKPSATETSWILPTLAIYFALDISLYLRGVIVPRLVKSVDRTWLLPISFFLLLILAMAVGQFQDAPQIRFPILIFFCLLLRTAISLGQNLAQSQFLMAISERRRSTAFSFLQMLTVVLFGGYSAVLAAGKLSVPSSQLAMQMLSVIAVAGLLLSFLKRRLEMRD